MERITIITKQGLQALFGVTINQWTEINQQPKGQQGIPWWLSGKESTCQCRRCGFNPWVGKTHWRRKWQPTLVFLPGESHGQRSLMGYSPWGCKRVGQDLATKSSTKNRMMNKTNRFLCLWKLLFFPLIF